MITFYQYEISPYCDKVRRIPNYRGLSYQVKNVSVMAVVRRSLIEAHRQAAIAGKWLAREQIFLAQIAAYIRQVDEATR